MSGAQDSETGLSHSQATLYRLLREYRGSVVRYETIFRQVYGIEPPTGEALKKQCSRANMLGNRLKRSLGGTDTVETVYRLGLRMPHRQRIRRPVVDRIGPPLDPSGKLIDAKCTTCGETFGSLGHGDSVCTACTGGIPLAERSKTRNSGP